MTHSAPIRALVLRYETHALLIVLALACLLRWPGCADSWLNPDEGIFYTVATRSSLSELIAQQQGYTAHPPLSYLYFRFLAWFSRDYVFLRLGSLAAGCVATWGMFHLGRKLGGPRVGLGAAFLFAVSPAAIEQSQVIRPYMLQCALLVWGEVALLAALRTRRRGALLAHTACMLLALLTHYSTFLVVAGHGVALALLWLRRPEDVRQRWGSLALAYGVIGVSMVGLYLGHIRPNLLGSARQLDAQATWLSPFFPASAQESWYLALGALRYLYGGAREGPLLLLLLGGLTCAARGRWQARYALGLSLSLIGLALVAAGLRQYPLGCTRHSSYLAVYLHPMVALAIAAWFRGPRPGRAAIASALIALACLFPAPLNRLLATEPEPSAAMEEHLVLPADVERLLAATRQAPGLLLMGEQTYFLLSPAFLSEPERTVVRGEDGSFFAFSWGASRVVVFASWDVSVIPGEEERPEHLWGLLQRLEAELPELELSRRRDAWIVSAGWTTTLAGHLLATDLHLPPREKRVVGSPLSRPYLSAFQYDVARYLSSAESRPGRE